MSGLGYSQDKTIYTKYGSANILDEHELTQIYLSEGLGSRIVSIIPQDATREWIYLTDDKVRRKFESEFERLNVEEAFCTALTYQRLYGGSLIIIGAIDGKKMDTPLSVKNIRSIEYLKPIDRTSINIQESIWDTDTESVTFGKIIKYKVRYYVKDTYVDRFIHYTRVIEFKGEPVPTGIYAGVDHNVRYWGISSLQSVYNALSALGSVTQNTINILLGFNAGTYKFKNLGALLAGGNESLLAKRLQAIETAVSTMNARVIDADEVYQKDYTSLAGLDQLISMYMLQLSGVTSIPMTRLFGKSPSGFSTGDSDIRNYYDIVESYQRNRLKPHIHYFLNLLCALHGFKPDVEFEFNSLYQLTEKEKAEISKLEAEARNINASTEEAYIRMGIRDSEDVAEEYGWEYTPPPEPVPPPEPIDEPTA